MPRYQTYNSMSRDPGERAKALLTHYFKTVFVAAGIEWADDNESEVAQIVDDLKEASVNALQVVTSALAREDEERWEALRQAAFDYVKAYNTWYTADCTDDDADKIVGDALTHAASALQAEAELYRKAGA